jgi:phosphoribosyl 1,2-cyclic phosphodiesterase
MTTPNAANHELTILGSRGSIPVSGHAFCRYGGNTTSMALSSGREVFAFIDAGTALNAYRDHDLVLDRHVCVFLTHYHWDHIQGLSMLRDMWEGHCAIVIYGDGSTEDMLTQAIRPPWFPVALATRGNISFEGVAEPVEIDSVMISSFPINHPQGAVGYRIDGPSASVAVITDHETMPEVNQHLQTVVEGVDTVIYDAQYLPSEMGDHIGWGHSTWKDAATFASEIGASQLILTSHDPARTDDEIDAIVASAREHFPNTQAAYPGLIVDL